MSKIIFLDIDGTLTDFGRPITERTKEALLSAKAAGHILMLCTGRTYCQISQDLLELPFDGIVGAAGAYIEYGGKELYHRIMETEQVSRLIAVFKREQIPLMLMGKESLYATREDKERIEESMRRHIPEDFEEMEGKIGEIRLLDDMMVLPEVEKAMFEDSHLPLEEIRRLLGEEFHVIPSSFERQESCGGEISLNKITKAGGIEFILHYLDRDKKDTIAFGDSYNDVEMLSYAGIGVAMGNAPAEVKKVADMVTSDVDKDGLYNGFLKLNLF